MSALGLLGIPAIVIPLVFVFGAVIGSFLNVLIWRLPREEKLNGRSHCPNCEHKLVWYDLIPVLSYTITKGTCRYCRKRISFRYPLIEIITGLLFVLSVLTFPLTNMFSSLLLLKAMVVIAVCVVVFMVDFEHYLILDKVVFPSFVIIFLFSVGFDVYFGTFSRTGYGILTAILTAVPFWLIWFYSKGKWMGYGDVKYMAFIGLALGMPGVLVALFVAFGVGAIVGVVLILLGKKQFSSKLPLGTFLSVATIIALLFGNQLWALYLNVFMV